MRAMLRDFMEILEHEVVYEAEGVEEAVTAFKRLTPDLTLLDLSLLDGSGLEVLDRIKRFDSIGLYT